MAEKNLTINDLADLITKSNDDLSAKMDNLQLKLDEKAINEVKEDIITICGRQDVIEEKYDKIDRILHLTDLLLHGIPKTPNENLRDILYQICIKIGFNSMNSELVSIFRINQKSKKSTMVLKFISNQSRNEFLFLFVECYES